MQPQAEEVDGDNAPEGQNWFLYMAVRRRGRLRPYDDEVQFGAREEIAVAVWDPHRDEVYDWLRGQGWNQASVEGATSERLAARL